MAGGCGTGVIVMRTSRCMIVLLALCLSVAAVTGCGTGKDTARESAPKTEAAEDTAPEATDDRFIESFSEVTPTSPNEKAVAAKADTYYEAWAAYRRNINAEVDLPTLDELGGNDPKFIGYCVAVYSGPDAAGEYGQFTLIVSGDQMNIAPEVGWKEPIDLTQEGVLDFYATRTVLNTWDVDPHHQPVSAGEKDAVLRVQEFVDTLPKELLFSRDRVRLYGYTFFWGESPAAESYLTLTVQPGDNPHYATANYGVE